VIFSFESYELDEPSFELRRSGEVVKLEPKVFDVLRYLVANRERVVTKTELLDSLWPGEHVTDTAIPRAVTAARKAIGDDRSRQALIRTVHGRGYQFVARVEERGGSEAQVPAQREAPDPATQVFVGRESALEHLEAALTDAAARRGRVVLLFGEPGIGKTRTAEELCELARRRGFDVVQGRCHEGEGVPAFWPWVQVLRSVIEEVPDADLADEVGYDADAIAHLVPELAERLGSTPPQLPPGADEARFRLFEGVTGYLRRRSAHKPLVVLIDDLHWADEPTSLLLQFLAREVKDSALLLIAGYREVEVRRGNPLGAVLGEISREPHAERIALRGLDDDQVAHFFEAVVGATPDKALVEAVAEITEGNPFFLWETVRLLRAEGALDDEAPRNAWDAALPQGLRDVVGRRLDRLSEACDRVLTLAAVIGPEFSVTVLERFAAQGPDALLELLDEAVRARVVVESAQAPGCYAFSHALIRQTIYEELPTPVRVRMHRELGEILEGVHGEASDAHVGELAPHFFQAAPGGDVDKAIDYAARAGAAAYRVLAWEEAAAWFTRALQALDLRVPDDSVRRCELLIELGEALASAGDRDRTRGAFREAAELARSIERSDLLARAAVGFAGRTERGAPGHDMRELLDDALAALGEEFPVLRARILSYLVGTPPYSESVETRIELSRQAVELARDAGDREALMWALSARCWAMPGTDYVEARLELAGELLETAEQERSTEFRLLGLEAQLRSYLLLGDADAADRVTEEYDSLARSLRQPAYLFLSCMNRVARFMSTARFDEAREEIDACFALGVRTKHPATNPLHWGQTFWLHRSRGDDEAILATIEPMMHAGQEWASTSVLRAAEAMLILGHHLEGREDEARRLFEKLARDEFADVPRDEHWFTLIAEATQLAVLFDCKREAEWLADLLRPVAHYNVVHDLLRGDLGSASHYLALCERLAGNVDEAIRRFEDAVAMNERMRAPGHLARSRVELAETLLGRDAPGDAGRAEALLGQADTAARELGLLDVIGRLEELRG